MNSLFRTFMGDPNLIIFGEPAEGLAPKIVELVADCLQALKADACIRKEWLEV